MVERDPRHAQLLAEDLRHLGFTHQASLDQQGADAATISFRKRFEGEQGTNPEELIAAAHSGCFSMALAVQLEQAGFTPERLETSAVVTLEKVPDGFSITRSDLTLRARVPGIEREAFGRLADAAKTGCPVSKLLNASISLKWTLG